MVRRGTRSPLELEVVAVHENFHTSEQRDGKQSCAFILGVFIEDLYRNIHNLLCSVLKLYFATVFNDHFLA